MTLAQRHMRPVGNRDRRYAELFWLPAITPELERRFDAATLIFRPANPVLNRAREDTPTAEVVV